MKFKKFAAAAAALSLCAGALTACGDSSEAPETTTSVSSETAVSEEMLVTDSDTETETETDTESAEGETGANPLQPLADAALESGGEWPSLWEVTDPQMLSDFFLLDAENENYRNMIVLQCPMSANMTEIIIIEADDTEAAMADLEARRKKAQEQDAFYPNDIEKAGASIVGSEGDYAYFILADNSSEAETAIIEAIKAL